MSQIDNLKPVTTSQLKSGASSEGMSRPNHLRYIDGLRGMAVSVVVVSHAILWSGFSPSIRWLEVTYKLLCMGVDLFLVLSGFCLFWPLVKSNPGIVKPLNLKVYAWRRFHRIAPPYYAALFLSIGTSACLYMFGGQNWLPRPMQDTFPWRGVDSWLDLLLHLSLFHGLFEGYTHRFLPPFWSLSLEWQFYFLLPVIVYLARKTSVLWTCGFVYLVSIAFRTFIKIKRPNEVWMTIWSDNSLARWSEFATGVAVATFASGAFGKTSSKIFKAMSHAAMPIAVWILILFIILTRGGFYLQPVIWGFGCGMLVLAAGQPGLLRRFLEHQLLVRLGTISYSVYLVHEAINQMLTIVVSRLELTLPWRAAVYFAAIFTVIPIGSAIFFRFFEKPFLNPQRKTNE